MSSMCETHAGVSTKSRGPPPKVWYAMYPPLALANSVRGTLVIASHSRSVRPFVSSRRTPQFPASSLSQRGIFLSVKSRKPGGRT